MFRYGTLQESTYPAPEVAVNVKVPESEHAGVEVDVILDTGAAMTVLPASLLDVLEVLDYGQILVQGAVGEAEQVLTAFVSLQIGPFVVPDQEVVILERPYGLLGRDVVNAFRVELNAPVSEWRMED